jgi:hypothetical protein
MGASVPATAGRRGAGRKKFFKIPVSVSGREILLPLVHNNNTLPKLGRLCVRPAQAGAVVLHGSLKYDGKQKCNHAAIVP